MKERGRERVFERVNGRRVTRRQCVSAQSGWARGGVIVIRGERSIVWARGPKEGRAL